MARTCAPSRGFLCVLVLISKFPGTVLRLRRSYHRHPCWSLRHQRRRPRRDQRVRSSPLPRLSQADLPPPSAAATTSAAVVPSSVAPTISAAVVPTSVAPTSAAAAAAATSAAKIGDSSFLEIPVALLALVGAGTFFL